MQLSYEANEMHADAAEYEARREGMEMALGEPMPRIPRGFQFAANFDSEELREAAE